MMKERLFPAFLSSRGVFSFRVSSFTPHPAWGAGLTGSETDPIGFCDA